MLFSMRIFKSFSIQNSKVNTSFCSEKTILHIYEKKTSRALPHKDKEVIRHKTSRNIYFAITYYIKPYPKIP